MIIVIATINLAENRRGDFLMEIRANLPHVLAEEGCLEYLPTVDLETRIPAQSDPRPNVVTIVEKWESLEALETHLIAPHMIEYRAKVKDMVTGVNLQVLQPKSE